MTENKSIHVIGDYSATNSEVVRLLESTIGDSVKTHELSRHDASKKISRRHLSQSGSLSIFTFPRQERYLIYDEQDEVNTFYKEIHALEQQKGNFLILVFYSKETPDGDLFHKDLERLWSLSGSQAAIKTFVKKHRFFSLKTGFSTRQVEILCRCLDIKPSSPPDPIAVCQLGKELSDNSQQTHYKGEIDDTKRSTRDIEARANRENQLTETQSFEQDAECEDAAMRTTSQRFNTEYQLHYGPRHQSEPQVPEKSPLGRLAAKLIPSKAEGTKQAPASEVVVVKAITSGDPKDKMLTKDYYEQELQAARQQERQYWAKIEHLNKELSDPHNQQKNETKAELERVKKSDMQHWKTKTDTLQQIVDTFTDIGKRFHELQQLMNKFHQPPV